MNKELNHKYISLVGTQAMAVLNPLLAVAKKHELKKIYLFPTIGGSDKPREIAENIKGYLIDNLGYDAKNILLANVSTNLEGFKGLPPIKTALSRLAFDDEDRLFFNIAGGLKFQEVSCESILDYGKTTLLYPEYNGIHAFTLKDGKFHHTELPLPDPIDAFDLMDLQGMNYTPEPQTRNSFFQKCMGMCDVKKWCKGVKGNIRIRNIVFDFVINNGNTLQFFHVIHSGGCKHKDKESRRKYNLKKRRAIQAMASNREAFGDLFHRQIMVLTDSIHVSEAINQEDHGKIHSLYMKPGMTAENREINCKKLEEFFNPENKKKKMVRGRVSEVINTGIENHDNTILYTAIGPNIVTTLISVWSHKPSKVCFLYTPGNPLIKKYIASMKKQKKLLPASKLIFHPISFTGMEITDLPAPPKGARLIVNITPGTKSHSFFLSAFARKYGGETYFINTVNRTLDRIHPSFGRDKELEAPNIVQLMELKGYPIAAPGTDKSISDTDALVIKRFIRMLVDEKRLDDFRGRESSKVIKLKNAKFVRRGKRGTIEIKTGRGTASVELMLEKDYWFEQLIGHLIKKSVDDMRIGLETDWELERRAKLRAAKKDAKQLSEIDVIARDREVYYLISCKSGKKGIIKNFSEEIQSAVPVFGGYSVPLIARLKYAGESKKHEDFGVWIFGYETILERNGIKKLLKKAYEQKQTT